MRAIVLLVVSLVAFLLGSGCVQGPVPSADENLSISVTIPPLAEMVEAIGGDHVRVTIILPPGADPHSYELTPSQLVAISDADVVVAAGSRLPFEDRLLESLTGIRPNLTVVNASEGIALLDNDPHYWLTPRNAKVMVDNIASALCAKDSSRCGTYTANRDAYRNRLDEADVRIRATLAQARINTFLVVHSAWRYFAVEYELTEIAIEEEGKEPSAARLAELVRIAREKGIRVVFVEPQFSTRTAETMAAQINGTVVRIDDLARNYVENLEQVATALKEA